MTAPVSQLFYTDRSRYEDYNRCPRMRFDRYHAGEFGCGIERQAKSVPLATGGSVHVGLAHVLEHVKLTDALPTPDVLDEGVAAAVADYTGLVQGRGLSYWEEGETAYQRLIDEQTLLIEGLVRAWVLWQLPDVLRTHRVMHVEEEHVAVFDCTCGLGDRLGGEADHVARGCTGIGLQGRADFVSQHRTTGAYRYEEFKTTADASPMWRDDFETTIQPYLGTVAIEASLGIQVADINVHGLIKGKRDHEYDSTTGEYSGPEYQNSRLVSAYFNTAAPEKGEWAVKAKWRDPDGKSRKLPNSFKKTPVSYFGSYQEYLDAFGSELAPQVLYTMTLPMKHDLREDALAGWIEQERYVRAALWVVYDALEAAGGDYSAPAVVDALNKYFRKTYECQTYGKKHACQFIPLSHRHPGHDNPALLGYVTRRPHHEPELLQLKARGIEPDNFPREGAE